MLRKCNSLDASEAANEADRVNCVCLNYTETFSSGNHSCFIMHSTSHLKKKRALTFDVIFVRRYSARSLKPECSHNPIRDGEYIDAIILLACGQHRYTIVRKKEGKETKSALFPQRRKNAACSLKVAESLRRNLFVKVPLHKLTPSSPPTLFSVSQREKRTVNN